MSKSKVLLPSLRFPEFKNSWARYELESLAKIRSASRVHKNEWTEQGVPFFRSSDVVSCFKGVKNKRAFISHQLFEQLAVKSGKLKKHDLLVTGGGSIGIPYLVTSNAPLYFKDADLLWFKISEKIHGYFLCSYLTTPIFRKYLASITHIGTIAHYTIEQAKSTPIIVPSLPEQKMIADFLTAVDKRIQQLTQKKALLEEYKKGVMQQLFSQTIRFKDKVNGEAREGSLGCDDGNDFPDWVERKLEELCNSEISNGVFNDPSKVGSGYRLINVGDMYRGSHIDIDSLSRLELEEHTFLKNRVKFGDIFFTRSSLVASGIAWSNVNLSNAGDITFDGHLMKISPDLSLYHPVFLAKLMMTYNVRKQFIQRGKTGTMTTIGQKDISPISFYTPCLAEQTKIANFLSAIDKKIENVKNQIIETKTFKKGLLQQMFV